jgi:hypothetical protein
MVAASRMQLTGNPVTDLPLVLERIQQLKQQLEEQRPQQPAPAAASSSTERKGRKLIFGQPFTFDGSRDGQKVITWLSKVDNQICMNARAFGEHLEDEDKVMIAENHLDEAPLRQYNIKVERDGRFATYEAFSKWIHEFYAPSDLLGLYRQQYRRCHQHQDETVEAYYLRFTEFIAKLDKPLDPSWQVSDFVNGLQTNFSKELQQYDDMSDFKKVTLSDVLKRLSRSARLAGIQHQYQNKSKDKNGKLCEHHISQKSKQQFKPNPSHDSQEPDVEKLTREQRHRVERLIEAGGGKFMGKDVKPVREWVDLSLEKDVCRNCAAKGHFARNCPLRKNKNGGGKDQLNALIPGLDSEIHEDIDYLFAMTERLPLAMFPCVVKTTMGIVMLDTGASRNYISLSYARRAGLRICQAEVGPNTVRLPNRHTMKVCGTTEFVLQMSEWKGTVQAVVLDMQSDFDIVLGLSWFRQWKLVPDWDTLEFTIETTDGPKTIRRLPELSTSHELSLDEYDEFNLITEKELKRELKKGCDIVLYFAKIDENGNENGQMKNVDGTKPNSVAGNVVWDANPELQELLESYKDVFQEELPDGLPPKRNVDHAIETGAEAPVNRNAYPLSVQQLQEQTRQIEQLLKRGLIRESSSPWGAPVLFVLKKSGEWRMCIDYRMLNSKTIKNAYPLPRIQECLDKLGKACFLTSLDLTSGYWQVRISDRDIPKTAFNTRYGKYEFLVMPFGLTNAPATFQTLMNSILRPYIDKFILVYLDDILIYSNSEEEHREHIKIVLQALREHKLYARPDKYMFNKPTVEFCGHIVGQGVIKVLDSKVKAIREWPQPRNVQEVRQFYGLMNYYRRFIRHFSIIAAPLSDLFKSNEDNDKRK